MYKLEWEHEGVYWKYYGEVSGEEVIVASTAIYGDPRFDSLRYKLVDFLDVENFKMAKDEVALIAYQHRAAEISNPNIKTAIVVGAGNGLANKFADFFSDSSWEVKVFHDLGEANIWLDRKPSC